MKNVIITPWVVICFQISIFEPLNTATTMISLRTPQLWFAFKLVSLSHWIQHQPTSHNQHYVVICFQISIFEPLNTAESLVKQKNEEVVICFQISIFEPLNTASYGAQAKEMELWFAFKLVSLSHWIQQYSTWNQNGRSCDLLSN